MAQATQKSSETVETLTVKVDGQVVEVPKTMPDPMTGKPVPTTMIQACALAKVDVPHYCYHPKLPVAGNCRMCLVEFGMPAMGPDRKPVLNEDGTPKIQKMPRPAIACATPVGPNMEIYTQTDGVKQMREGVLEFLLINHPLDCPICDQAGECKLQEYSVEHGQSTSRFAETKVHKPKQVDLGPRIMLDDERCILCSRCIRFTRDIAGDDALGFINRGGLNTLSIYPGRPFDNNYTLNTVDLCPVGALTSKDFRFQMRVWFLKETKSLCTSCGTGCNTLIGSRENKMYRYTPRENDGVNSSWMCDSGRLNYKWIQREDRLQKVQMKLDGKLQEVSWEAALAALAPRLKNLEKDTVAVLASARSTNEELYLVSKLTSALGALSDVVSRSGESDNLLVSADKNPNSNGAILNGVCTKRPGYRLKKMVAGIQEGNLRCLIAIGEDPHKIGLTQEDLAKLDLLVLCDIHETEASAVADFVLPGCAHAEKRGTFTSVKGRVQKFFKALEPVGMARPEVEILSGLLHQITGEEVSSVPPVLFNQMTTENTAWGGLRWSDLGEHGVTLEL